MNRLVMITEATAQATRSEVVGRFEWGMGRFRPRYPRTDRQRQCKRRRDVCERKVKWKRWMEAIEACEGGGGSGSGGRRE